ncbi:MAG: sugar transferase [Clostridium fessum]
MDFICSSIGIVVLSPFSLLVALSIYLTDRGPVFYKQTRLTEGGKEFQICKFRTMIQNAEAKTGARLAAEHDDRILPVGHFLRRTRLDELPQLFNIWKGEMSIVVTASGTPGAGGGDREKIPEFCYRLKMKAGLTGYAQVYGKYNTTSYDKLKLDLTYIRNYSLLLDLKLILMTPKIMMLKESTEGVADNGKASDSRHPGV